VPPLSSTSVIDLDARDRIERNRVSLEHRFNDLNALAFSAPKPASTGRTPRSANTAAEDRYTAADRTRDNRYQRWPACRPCSKAI
jgi:hemoglobin/transferrin/lactoferrin receptor protein